MRIALYVVLAWTVLGIVLAALWARGARRLDPAPLTTPTPQANDVEAHLELETLVVESDDKSLPA